MSNELIRELVEALDFECDKQGLYGKYGDLLAKARAYLASGGWTKVKDGLPKHDRRNEPPLRIWVSMNGEAPFTYLYVHGDDPSGMFTHWRYAEHTPEPPKG